MDGDLAPLAELAEVAERYEAMLMIDEAHATGVFGASGRGVAESLGVEARIPVRVGTLEQGPRIPRRLRGGPAPARSTGCVNRARPYVFSTAAPAAVAAASPGRAGDCDRRTRTPQDAPRSSGRASRRLAEQGWNIGHSASQIIPVIVGEAEAAVRLSASLCARRVCSSPRFARRRFPRAKPACGSASAMPTRAK